MNISIRKKVALITIISFALMSIITPTVSHASVDYGQLNITPLTSNMCMISDGENVSTLSCKENSDNIKVDISDETSSNYFIIDKKTDTLYSSYTNSYISKSEFFGEDLNSIDKISSASASSIVTKYLSYNQLGKLVSATSTIASIAGAILTVLAWLGITAANPVA